MSIPGIVHSPKMGIPLYRVVDIEEGDNLIEYHNDRTGVKEIVNIDRFIIYLLSGRIAGEKEMIYTPRAKIPIGAYIHDENGNVYIEVKNKKLVERICISQYVAMLMESKAQKIRAVS